MLELRTTTYINLYCTISNITLLSIAEELCQHFWIPELWVHDNLSATWGAAWSNWSPNVGVPRFVICLSNLDLSDLWSFENFHGQAATWRWKWKIRQDPPHCREPSNRCHTAEPGMCQNQNFVAAILPHARWSLLLNLVRFRKKSPPPLEGPENVMPRFACQSSPRFVDWFRHRLLTNRQRKLGLSSYHSQYRQSRSVLVGSRPCQPPHQAHQAMNSMVKCTKVRTKWTKSVQSMHVYASCGNSIYITS